ncbi:hypothetical protein BJF93_15575 [Xaviernesmea oryzae]|uniref:Phosphonate metabolism protein n=1 Tax=Xaviernesmea oryzae TaxID=464029 RepID=A0A1Q9AY54_9HYPH|nr:DUF1045 domain-containing protein [Xaviernesmea oryzae]OLP60367.1 hypothetical protein BJF93_15575 [Xaviernesmea oryzae]SEK21284.1 putative phosphonate metabolism protein [Xaviernesmea oryzae]
MRYALYFTPPADDPLTLAAACWLGRDAFSGAGLEQPDVPGLSPERFRELTEEPRRYGFHATLKAPFALKDGTSEEALVRAFTDFAKAQAPFDIPELTLARIGSFFALVSGEPCAPLQDFGAAAVRAFEPFRAPLSEADIARRKPDSLSERQRLNLMDWGYPYVFEDFRFHMTLSGRVPEHEQPALQKAAEECFAVFIGRPLTVTTVGLFEEPARGAPFRARALLPLTGLR